MARYTLGLDLGSNSVGWALIAQDGTLFDNRTPILAGARVFPAGVADLETGKEKARGQERREKRSQRRILYRRRTRRGDLRHALADAGLCPTGRDDVRRWLALEPYTLRARGLDERLHPREFGRALYHLCERRGFKSNRKTESKDDNKVTKGASALQAKIEAAACRTLGEYCAKRLASTDHRADSDQRIRGPYTLRAMYEQEFDSLWDSQRRFHPDLLTDDLKRRVHKTIFFQRPLRFDPKTIGDCELEQGEKRCARAHWASQRFRMLQEINHLRVMDTGGDRPLRREEREKLADALGQKKKMTFDQIRKCLGLRKDQPFNLEEQGKRDWLHGNEAQAALRGKALKAWYETLPEETRIQVWDALADVQDEDELRRTALGPWGCTEPQADQLIKISLTTGHFSLSLKAIRKMLPFLEPSHVCDDRCRELFPERDTEAGHVVSEAKQLAGYALLPEVQIHDRLPPAQTLFKQITNPLVRRALTETRKVVNAIVREFGKPEEIVLELARDLKHSRQQRQEIHWENRNRGKENDKIRERLQREFNILTPSRDDIIKYRLWEECQNVCVYTGQSIPKTKLFSPEVQIEHIYPLDRSLDDSYLNKTLCYGAEVNRRKGGRTPHEAYDGTPEYEQILQRAKTLPWKKRRRFEVKDVQFDEFARRQLNDTRYASRMAMQYLRSLGVPVRPVKGQTTNNLAHYWGLYGVLGTDYSKTRDDHRYHAIDAITVALTTRSHLQALARAMHSRHSRAAAHKLAPPWETFWDDAQAAVERINISFRPTRKLAGKLHEETAYGPTEKPNNYAYRVPVERLTPAMVAGIRDTVIRGIVRKRLKEHAIEEKGSGTLGKVLTEPTLRMPSGVPIKRVRIGTVEKTAIEIRRVNGQAAKFVLPGGNHHVEIFQKPDGSWTGRCVSRFEAHQRLRQGKGVVDHQGEQDWTFLMSLCINDMVQLTDPDTGEVKLYRVQKISSGSHMVVLRLHTAAEIEDEASDGPSDSCNQLRRWRMEKVQVDPLGRVFPCDERA